MAVQSEFTLKVGESTPIKRGIFRDQRLVYAGMPGENVFSLALTFTQGYNSSAYNLYFPANNYEMTLLDQHLIILRVDPHQIRFRFER
jgi:hypothetical protein